MIAAGNDAIFSRLCTALDLPELAEDPRFVSNPERVAHRADLDPLVEGATERLTTEELLRRTKEHSIPASAIQSIDQVVDDPQVLAAGMFPPVAHPTVAGYRDVSLPLRMDGARPRAERVPPSRGEHSLEILEELGFEPDEIEALLETGAVTQGD